MYHNYETTSFLHVGSKGRNMDINTIITVSVYCLFFIGLIAGALIGLKRGLKKSSLRLGSLALFLLIAGFITYPISKALLTINLSSLNINVGGTAVSTIPELIRNGLFSINGFQEAAEAMPSIMTLVEGLPVALMNVIVFTLLIFVMMFLSWILYIILSHTVLKETKLEKQIRKQKKLEKKNKVTPEQLTPGQKPKAIPLGPPNKRRLWGALIGTVQAFLLMFLILIPITSLTGSFGEVLSNPNVNNSLVYADDDESLSEYSSDIIKNLIGTEIVSYFETFNNSVPTKMLSLGGLNKSIFDAFSTVTVNGEGIALRRDAVAATKIYDSYIMILEEIGENENLTDADFQVVRDAVDLVFETGLFRAFAEDAIPYAVDFIFSTEMMTDFSYSTELKEALDLAIATYKKDSSGFISGLKKDVVVVLNIAESAVKCGLVDEVVSDLTAYEDILETVKSNNYKFLYSLSNESCNSVLFRIAISKSMNVLLDFGSEKMSNKDYAVDLGDAGYENVNWNSMKDSLFGTLKTALDIYDIINLYGIDSLSSDFKATVGDIGTSDLSTLISLAGKELDFIKDSSIFAGQETNPVKSTILWLGQLSSVKDFIDAPAMLEVGSWQTELSGFSGSIVGIKDSGVLNLLLESNSISSDLELIIDTLLEPSSEKYVSKILNPILNSSITKKLIVYAFNEANSILNEAGDFAFNDFKREDFTASQNADIVVVVENFLKCFSMFNTDDEFDLEKIDTEKLAGLLSALQSNAFRKGTASELENANVNLTKKTVSGGGIFANYYISFVTYIISPEANINYKSIDWSKFFTSAQALSSNIDDIIGNGSFEDLVNLGDSTSKEDLENLLDSLGLDSSVVSDLSDIQDALNNVDDEPLAEEEYETINNALTNLLTSPEGEENAVDTIISMIETFTEGELSNQISTEAISKEQVVSNRLHILSAAEHCSSSNPIDYSSPSADPVHSGLNIFEGTIKDLTCGGTYILQKAIVSGTKIYITNIDEASLIAAINAETADVKIRSLVLSIFQ